jgi:hypothetical protein
MKAEKENRWTLDAEVRVELGPLPGPAPLPSASSAPQPTVHDRAEPVAPLEPVVLPGSPAPAHDEELPDIPRAGIDWENLDVLREHLLADVLRGLERLHFLPSKHYVNSCSCIRWFYIRIRRI